MVNYKCSWESDEGINGIFHYTYNDKKKLFDKVGIKYRLTRMIKKIQEKVNSMSFIPKYHPMHKKSHTKENSQKNRLFQSNATKNGFNAVTLWSTYN